MCELLNVIEEVYNFEHESSLLRVKVAEAVLITETALQQFGPAQIAICFTGGKDCTVVLHILYAVLKKLYPDHNLTAWQSSTFEPFPEVDQFIDETQQRYGFQLISYVGEGMQKSVHRFVEDYPNIKAVFMGTRRSDPDGVNLTPMQKTDPTWPELTRVNPILDWDHSDVWDFIRCLRLPYCSLYDRGYTSLGNPSKTQPNPQLLSQSPRTLRWYYRPAYELKDESTERLGRGA